jgi:hypothetical protein
MSGMPRSFVFEKQSNSPARVCFRVGHIFCPGVLFSEHSSTQERKLNEVMAERADEEGRAQLLTEAQQLRKYAQQIRQMIEKRPMPQVC